MSNNVKYRHTIVKQAKLRYLSLSPSPSPFLSRSLPLPLPLPLLSLSFFLFLSLSLPLILPGLAHCRPVSIYSHHALWQGISRGTPLRLCRDAPHTSGLVR